MKAWIFKNNDERLKPPNIATTFDHDPFWCTLHRHYEDCLTNAKDYGFTHVPGTWQPCPIQLERVP